jgi:beta-galactosidase
VSAEILPPSGDVNPEYIEIFDILGVNYPESKMMGDNLGKTKAKYPKARFLNSETASYFSTRGAYDDDWERVQCSNFGSRYSMMASKENPAPMSAGGTARPEDALGYYATHTYSGGVFIWTGFDYRGEPSPFPWPAISSQFGILDTCGFPKDYYYYYKAHWTNAPLVHAMPHWTHPGKDGQSLKVRVFSNCGETEIFINGKSQGKKPCATDYNEWDAVYEPGCLLTVGYNNGGEAAREEHKTALQPQKLKLCLENGQQLETNKAVVLSVHALDSAGVENPLSDNSVSFEVLSGGKLLGLGNGDAFDHSDDKANVRRLFYGKACAVVKAEKSGKLVVIAKSAGLEDAVLELEVI